MSFIIWYKVEFNKDDGSEGLLSAQLANVLPLGPSLPLTVSNDIFSGKYILDANITLTMNSGGNVDTFEITLLNLPSNVVDALKLQANSAKKKETAPLLAKIYLGYFDEITTTHASEPVLTGGVLTAVPDVGKDGLRTIVLTGQEIGGYRLSVSELAKGASIEGKVPVKKLLTDTISGTRVGVESSFGTEPDLKNYKFRSSNKLGAVREIAERAHAPLVIRDKKIYIGSAVGSEPAPQPLSIVQEQSPLQKAQKTSGKDGTTSTTIFTRKKLTVLGHPLLRVGQVVKLENQNFRIEHLVHKFSVLQQGAGYTCEMILVQAEAGELVPENVQGAQGVGNNVKSMVASIQSRVPVIDIGEVKTYKEDGHLATLKHGQTVATGDVSPSIRVKVNDVAPLIEKPIASPFAWQKCGLIVPVYQGMRAVLAHNLGIVNDAIVTGFIWPDEPKYERPKNKPGDYWLCLPTKVENGQPTGKGVNDLTDASGLRVIQSKGLHVFVGDDQLPDVGVRPAVPDAKTIVIEHESGTKITITNNGALKIEAAQGKDITMTSGDSSITVGGDGALQIKAAQGKDITMTNGGVTLKLGSSGVEIS